MKRLGGLSSDWQKLEVPRLANIKIVMPNDARFCTASVGQTFTFRPLNERPLLSADADQARWCGECHEPTFLSKERRRTVVYLLRQEASKPLEALLL
jgi:hypothetical protein